MRATTMPMSLLRAGLRRRAWDARLATAWLAPALVPWVQPGGLRARWVVPVTVPLILVSQVQRSGGTLLTRLFDDHPECFAHPYELLWGKGRGDDAPHWPQLDPHRPAADLQRSLEQNWLVRLARAGAYDKGGAGKHPFIFDTALQHRLFAAGLAAAPPRCPRDVLDRYLTAFFNAWLDCQHLYREPKRFVTAFSSGLILDAASRERFRRDYPDGWLVSIVREPVSWFASASRFQGRRRVDDVDAAVTAWTASTDAALAEASAHPERTIVLCFEDLVRQPEALMRGLCAATGLSFLPGLLEPTFNGRPVASNSSFASVMGLDASAASRATEVAAGDAARIERAAGPLYRAVRQRFALR